MIVELIKLVVVLTDTTDNVLVMSLINNEAVRLGVKTTSRRNFLLLRELQTLILLVNW